MHEVAEGSRVNVTGDISYFYVCHALQPLNFTLVQHGSEMRELEGRFNFNS